MSDTATREKWEDQFPTKLETRQIIALCLDAGMKLTAAETEPFDALHRSETTVEGIEEWIQDQRGDPANGILGRRPHLFVNFSGGQFDLEKQAFEDVNITARSKLVSLIGEADAAQRSRDWGLRGLDDFRRGVAKQPDNAVVALGDEARKLEREIAERQAALAKVRKELPKEDARATNTTNPFTRLRNSNPEVREAAQAQIASMLAKMPTKAVAGIAASAGYSLDGRPLRR